MDSPLATATLQAICTASDAAASRAFYGDTLGLELLNEDGFGIEFRSGTGVVRIAYVEKVVLPQATALGWRVADVRAAVSALSARGVTFERFPGMAQDDLGIWTPPGSSGVAWFRDPAGNLLSVSG